eukprot:SAG31_NODE_33781_length_340_cov_0.647303_1_plen_38_part_10
MFYRLALSPCQIAGPGSAAEGGGGGDVNIYILKILTLI